MDSKLDQKLLKLYTDPGNSGSFSGLKSFYNYLKKSKIKISWNQLKKWSEQQAVYTLHKPIKKKFIRNRVIVSGIDDTWQMDLVDMKNFSSENNGYKYLLTCIDVFSKYAWIIPLKSKSGIEVLRGIQNIMTLRKPKRIQVDEGTEFYNKNVLKFLKTEDIKLYSTKSVLKASIVERFNRTIKQKMWRMFTFNENKNYIKHIQKLTDSYNNTYHSSIKEKPVAVTKTNSDKIWMNLYGYKKNNGSENIIINKFKKGDKVAISKHKFIFDKGYTPNWVDEEFTIHKVLLRDPVVYILKDGDNTIIDGTFYAEEIQKIQNKKIDKDVFIIDKVIKTRIRKGKSESFVSWKGYPSSQNSWIPSDDILR